MYIKTSHGRKKFDISSEIERNKMIEKLLIEYINEFPFFINLLISVFDIKNVEDNHKDELAYTKPNFEKERIEIYINFKKFEEHQLEGNKPYATLSYGNKEILFIIFHELLHHYLYHFTRFKENNLLINIITDYYVNSLCKELLGIYNDNIFNDILGVRIVDDSYISYLYSKICQHTRNNFPTFFELREKWVEERVYELFLKKKSKIKFNISDFDKKIFKKELSNIDNHNIFYEEFEKQSKPINFIQKNSESDNSSENFQEKIIDNANKNNSESSNQEYSDNDNSFNNFQEKLEKIYDKIRSFEAEYENSSKSYGTLESSIYERKMKALKADYFLNTLKLKRVVTKALNTNIIKTYKNLNRKRQNEEIVFKGNKKINGYKLIVAIDVSGSISENDLEKFVNMLYGLNKKKKDYLFDIIYWSNNNIKENKTYYEDITDIKKIPTKEIYSTGGTDISYLHNYLNERYKEPIEVVNITDGEFYYDKKLNKNILKYHFVLTEKIDNNFSSFYSDKIFSIISMKN